MTLTIAAIVLLAAGLNAGWNALVKIGGDRVAGMAVLTVLGSLLSVPMLLLAPMPEQESWPFLACTIVVHTAYHFLLPIAYNHGDFGQVYPISRGSAPLLVTLGAAVFAGEVLESFALIGVVCLAFGVMALALEHRDGAPKAAVPWALATGISIASYTVLDGLGARHAGSILGFAAWLTVGDGVLTFAIAMLWRPYAVMRAIRIALPTRCLGAAMQVGAYWIAVWALAHAPLGMVSALRETSVLFGALISTFLFREGLGVWRFVSASLVVFGIALTHHNR